MPPCSAKKTILTIYSQTIGSRKLWIYSLCTIQTTAPVIILQCFSPPPSVLVNITLFFFFFPLLYIKKREGDIDY